MSDNLINVKVTRGEWVDLYDATGLPVGTRLTVENSGACDVYLAAQAAQPAKDHNSYNVVKRAPSISLQNSAGDLGAWAYCQGSDGKLSISSAAHEGFTPAMRANLSDGAGNPLSAEFHAPTNEWILNVHPRIAHHVVVDRYIHQHTAISTTLAAPTVGDGTEYQIDVADATGFVVNDPLHINTTSTETTHPIVLAISAPTGPATFTLDRRIDRAHAIGDTIIKCITNMASQDGTLPVPQVYLFGPETSTEDGPAVWLITRILFEMTHAVAGDLGKFGGITALTNGVVLRVRVNGQYGTLTNWKRNGEIKTDMFNVEFDNRSGGQGDFGTSGRGTFTETGAVLRLDSATNDRLEVHVQDPLDTDGLNTFTMKGQGNIEA